MEHRLDVLQGCPIVRQLVCKVLRILRELEVGVLQYGARARLQGACYEVRERRFPGTIRAKDGDT